MYNAKRLNSRANANIDYAMTSRDVQFTNPPFCEWAIIGQTSQNTNIDYVTRCKKLRIRHFEVGDNRANLTNANIDYAMTSRDVKFTNPPVCEWAIIRRRSQPLPRVSGRLC